jgi:iron complex outermembrane receptor protein
MIRAALIRSLAALALCLAASDASAQTGRISGRVTDPSGEPLIGVNVTVLGTTTGAATDLEGRYEIGFVPLGTQVIVASAIGFRSEERTVQVTEGSVLELDFVLREAILLSGEVVVTASRRAQSSAEVPASVAVLSPRDLEARNVVALDDALRYIPGVHVQENQVNVRGSAGFAYNTGSRVLLLLDGMPILTPDSEGIPFDALPFAQIERIEVLKGPGSALYGSGAIGGVVNVITKRFPDKPRTEIRLFAGAWEPTRYAVWKEPWPEGKDYRPFGGVTLAHARRFGERLGAWVNLAWRQDEGYLQFGKTRLFQGYAKIGWDPSPSVRTGLLVGMMSRKKDNFLFWNGGRDALRPGTLPLGTSGDPTVPSGTNDMFANQISVMPTVSHVVSARFLYTVKGRLFGTILRPIDNVTGEVKSVDDGTLGFRYGAEVQADWEPREGSHATFGGARDALATRSSFYVTSDGDSTGSQPETALFAQWEQDAGERLRLVAGLRYDRYAIDAVETSQRLSPKLSATWKLNGTATLRAAFGYGFRVPSLAERFTDNRDFFPIVRNPEIRPERSIGYEVGARVHLPVLGRGLLQLDGAVFWNDYWDLIEPRLKPEIQAFQFDNLTRARIRGAEVSADLRLDDHVVRVGYAYLDADDLSMDEALSFRSRHQLTTGADIAVYGPIEVGADFRLVSRPERVDSDFARFVKDADRLVPVRLVDLRLALRGDRYRVALLVQNALEYYHLERPAYLGPPRRFTLQVRYEF